MYYGVERSNDLYHHGIKGQRWGERRYQNEDGSLTPEGKIHYGVGDKIRSNVTSVKTRVGNTINKVKTGVSNKVSSITKASKATKSTGDIAKGAQATKKHLSTKAKVAIGAGVALAVGAATVATILGVKAYKNKSAAQKEKIRQSIEKAGKEAQERLDKQKRLAADDGSFMKEMKEKAWKQSKAKEQKAFKNFINARNKAGGVTPKKQYNTYMERANYNQYLDDLYKNGAENSELIKLWKKNGMYPF